MTGFVLATLVVTIGGVLARAELLTGSVPTGLLCLLGLHKRARLPLR